MHDEKVIRVFLTKYALTTGIIEIDAVITKTSPDMVRYRLPSAPFDQYEHRGKWFLTREQAVAKAESMRKAKLKSLQKQVAKFETMRFE